MLALSILCVILLSTGASVSTHTPLPSANTLVQLQHLANKVDAVHRWNVSETRPLQRYSAAFLDYQHAIRKDLESILDMTKFEKKVRFTSLIYLH